MFQKRKTAKESSSVNASGIRHDLSIKAKRIRPNISMGADKISTYLEDFLKSTLAISSITKLRKEIGIPLTGFPLDEDLIEDIYNKYTNNEKYTAKIFLTFQKIKEQIPELNMPELDLVLYSNLLFNVSEPRVIKSYFYWNNVCKIADAKEEWDLCIDENCFNIEKLMDIIECENKTHPIHLRISPYASQNDITDFIKHHWDIIEDRQKRHLDQSVQLGKTRARNPEIQKRNQFIYDHKNLPRRDISTLVADTFTEEVSRAIDQGSVGKIISIKKKKEIKN